MMRNPMKRGAYLAAVAGILGAAAMGTASATEWDQLKGSAWGGSEAGASAEAGAGSEQMASVESDAAINYGAEIATAFQNLGMDAARAECYGNILAEQLSPQEQEQAVQLVSSASTGEEVRLAVMDAGPTMVGGFSAANTSCPEGMGG